MMTGVWVWGVCEISQHQGLWEELRLDVTTESLPKDERVYEDGCPLLRYRRRNRGQWRKQRTKRWKQEQNGIAPRRRRMLSFFIVNISYWTGHGDRRRMFNNWKNEWMLKQECQACDLTQNERGLYCRHRCRGRKQQAEWNPQSNTDPQGCEW